MAQNSDLSLQFFASGFCTAHAQVVNPKEGKGKTTFYAVWALLNIPNVGYVMFDTGYSDAFHAATKPFPDRFYRWATPVTLKRNESASAILIDQGIHPNSIKYIIISHFHADHIAGLKDFSNAKFICSEDAIEEVLLLEGFKAVKKGILHRLFPSDFYERLMTIEAFADHQSINEFGMIEFGLFGMSEFKVVILPGHASGMLGFIYSNNGQSIFYGTDASWSIDTFNKGILPKKIVKLFFDSWDDYTRTIDKIKNFKLANPQYNILFTHCKETLKYISNEI